LPLHTGLHSREEHLAPGAYLDARRGGLLRTFGAFRHTNFRIYFVGLLISVLGVWAQNVAQSWLVYKLTNSALVLGQVTFMAAIPVLLIGPWSGVVIDRTSRRTVLILTQTLFMVQAFTLAFLDFSGLIAVWHVMVLAAWNGIGNAFDAPARQAIVVELVGKEDMSNGIALNSTMFSLARTFGPALGGLIVAALGTAWGFTINGITFLAILFSLAILRLEKPVLQPRDHSPMSDLMEGLRFIWQHKPIVGLIVVALGVALFGGNVTVLMPVIAVEVLGQQEVGFGLLGGAIGLGSVIGALYVAYSSTLPGRGRRLNVFNIAFPLALAAVSFSRSYILSLLLLVVVGLTFLPQLSLCNMLIQTNIPDHIRGRVMSVYTLFIFGAWPIGGLIAGALAEWINAPVAILISAVALLIIGLAVRLLVPEIKDLE